MLLALAPLYALVVASISYALQAPVQCKTDVNGIVSGNYIRQVKVLPSVLLPAYTKEFEVAIREEELCAPKGMVGTYHSGTLLTVCDYDEPPQVTLLDQTRAVVSRRGTGYLPGIVTATVVCRGIVSEFEKRRR